jgi:hypothetical protein
MKFLIPLLFLLGSFNNLHSQAPGCTDPQANNFDRSATTNNGSCSYDPQSYSPPLVKSLNATLKEISGIIYYKNRLVALNDGGGGNKLYMLDTANGNILQTITVEGATNVDWEDIAQDSNYIYVGDIGNNAHGNRTDLCIYKISKSAFVDTGDFTIPAIHVEKINYSYSDQTDFTSLASNTTRYDCESMIIARDSIHLFSKNWVDSFAVHYVLSPKAGTQIAERLDSLDTGGYMLTGADAGAWDEILFTSYNQSGDCSLFLLYGFDSTNNFFTTGNKRQIQLPGVLTSGQVESVCFVNGIHGFIANEYFTKFIFNVSNNLRRFSTKEWIIDYYRNKPSLAEKGMLRYNSSTAKYEVFSGADWEPLN